jgi:hypothetical protein
LKGGDKGHCHKLAGFSDGYCGASKQARHQDEAVTYAYLILRTYLGETYANLCIATKLLQETLKTR